MVHLMHPWSFLENGFPFKLVGRPDSSTKLTLADFNEYVVDLLSVSDGRHLEKREAERMGQCLALLLRHFAVLFDVGLVADEDLDGVVRREVVETADHVLGFDEAQFMSHVVEEDEDVQVDKLPGQVTFCTAVGRPYRLGSSESGGRPLGSSRRRFGRPR